jgi:hypothetical protein
MSDDIISRVNITSAHDAGIGSEIPAAAINATPYGEEPETSSTDDVPSRVVPPDVNTEQQSTDDIAVADGGVTVPGYLPSSRYYYPLILVCAHNRPPNHRRNSPLTVRDVVSMAMNESKKFTTNNIEQMIAMLYHLYPKQKTDFTDLSTVLEFRDEASDDFHPYLFQESIEAEYDEDEIEKALASTPYGSLDDFFEAVDQNRAPHFRFVSLADLAQKCVIEMDESTSQSIVSWRYYVAGLALSRLSYVRANAQYYSRGPAPKARVCATFFDTFTQLPNTGQKFNAWDNLLADVEDVFTGAEGRGWPVKQYSELVFDAEPDRRYVGDLSYSSINALAAYFQVTDLPDHFYNLLSWYISSKIYRMRVPYVTPKEHDAASTVDEAILLYFICLNRYVIEQADADDEITFD